MSDPSMVTTKICKSWILHGSAEGDQFGITETMDRRNVILWMRSEGTTKSRFYPVEALDALIEVAQEAKARYRDVAALMAMKEA